MKVLKCDSARKRDNVRREINILKNLNHPIIIKYRDSIEDGDNFYIIMDLASGN